MSDIDWRVLRLSNGSAASDAAIADLTAAVEVQLDALQAQITAEVAARTALAARVAVLEARVLNVDLTLFASSGRFVLTGSDATLTGSV